MSQAQIDEEFGVIPPHYRSLFPQPRVTMPLRSTFKFPMDLAIPIHFWWYLFPLYITWSLSPPYKSNLLSPRTYLFIQNQTFYIFSYRFTHLKILSLLPFTYIEPSSRLFSNRPKPHLCLQLVVGRPKTEKQDVVAATSWSFFDLHQTCLSHMGPPQMKVAHFISLPSSLPPKKLPKSLS